MKIQTVIVTSAALGTWGCGAYCLAAWLQYQWPPGLKDQHITVKELLPIVIAIAILGAEWANKSILCHCDNEAVVHIINSGTSKDPGPTSDGIDEALALHHS